GRDVDELQRALARQRIEREVTETPLVEGADRLVEREAAGDADASAVVGDLFEVGGRGHAELFSDVGSSARAHHHRIAQPEALGRIFLQPPTRRREACMAAKRYGPVDGKSRSGLADYHQSKDELAGLPQTVAEKIPVTNTPNIFSYKAYVFAKNPALVQRYIKATKADVGGVGGHVVAAEGVKSIIDKFVLDNNGYRGEPMFSSF